MSAYEKTVCPGCGGPTIGGYRCNLCTSEDKMQQGRRQKYAAHVVVPRANPFPRNISQVTRGLGWSVPEGEQDLTNMKFVKRADTKEEASRAAELLCQCLETLHVEIKLCRVYAVASLAYPTPGTTWRHTNGNRYEVLHIANEHTQDAQRYPVTIVYRGLVNGLVWTRAADDWHRSMTQVSE